MKLTIGYLYPDLLNIYGDQGNILALKKRCQWRNIDIEIIPLSIKQKIKPKTYDIFFGGGGQDKQQLVVAKDLIKKEAVLKQEANRGVPMLLICGTYQLFGHYFKTNKNVVIKGISVFEAITLGSNIRKIGNVEIRTKLPLQQLNLVGFENHSGNTYLTPLNKQKSAYKTFAMGKVIKGFGNNGKDKTEGAVYQNVFGCYLHGPLLPKNPHLCDYLIKLALEIKYQKQINLEPLNDKLEWQAFSACQKLKQ